MELFMNEEGRSVDTMYVKNKSDDPFNVVFDSRVIVIPPKTVVKIPCSHHSALTMQPGAEKYIELVDPSKGNAEWLESERKRKIGEVENAKRALAQAQADLQASQRELKVANAKLESDRE